MLGKLKMNKNVRFYFLIVLYFMLYGCSMKTLVIESYPNFDSPIENYDAIYYHHQYDRTFTKNNLYLTFYLYNDLELQVKVNIFYIPIENSSLVYGKVKKRPFALTLSLVGLEEGMVLNTQNAYMKIDNELIKAETYKVLSEFRISAIFRKIEKEGLVQMDKFVIPLQSKKHSLYGDISITYMFSEIKELCATERFSINLGELKDNEGNIIEKEFLVYFNPRLFQQLQL